MFQSSVLVIVDKCLLYLMLLFNGLTVSKNIDNSYFDGKVESLHDFEYTTRHKSKHDKFLYKLRTVKSDVRTPVRKVTVRVTTNEAKSTKATLKPHIKQYKSTKRRIGGFWRKFKTKEDKSIEKEKRLEHQYQNVKHKYERPSYGEEYKNYHKRLVTKRRKNTCTLSFEKQKREATYKGLQNIKLNITPYENTSNTLEATTRMKALSNDEEFKKIITSMTKKVTELKIKYGLEIHKPSYTSSDKILFSTKQSTTPTTTENLDIPGTAQLEALLNDIKEKSLHLIVEQNPDITDLITNTVTETTFEADPLLTHLEINRPEFSLYTFITLNNNFEKRGAITMKQNNENTKTNAEISTDSHREGRSVAEEAMTAAQSIEDILQKEIKIIYKKIKNKVSGDFRKEVNKIKTTLKPESKKICTKEAPTKQPAATKPVTERSKNNKNTSQSVQNRIDRKSGKCTSVTEQEIPTTPTADDYALLTLYEQMLSKTCQNNIMNMVTSRDTIVRKKRNKQLVSKRNLETLFDQNLKENNQKLYENREDIPEELEYPFDVNLPEISTAETTSELDSHTIDNESETKNESHEDVGVEITPYDDNSYEGISSQISYNEYVNGYKHYLNFQKEQANEKFSNLVRYQAHKHHNVDDIGKYILSKIPQLPSRDKRFFEYEHDHDSSTKNEESWFKKNFYMFIDKGTPKKYHTAQTISLKSPTSDTYDTEVHTTDPFERNNPEDNQQVSPEIEANNVDINLDKLSQVLEYKSTTAVLPAQENDLTKSGKRHGHIFRSLTPPHIIEKVFGKGRKSLEKAGVESNNRYSHNINLEHEDLNYETSKDINISFMNELDRQKRNTKKLKDKTTTLGEKLIFETKKATKLINLSQTKKKTDIAKLGCVDIDVILPPTAIVKLKGTKRKEGKFKKLLKKLHLSKSDKKKVKRSYHNTESSRKQRSNPFQKLKNIFKSTPKGNVLKAGSHLSDYDIMSSHIDTFKSMKFDKILNIEEMKKQIPNITGDLSGSAAPKFADNDISWNPRTTKKGFTDFTVLLNTTLTSLPTISASNSLPLIEDPYGYRTTKTTKKGIIQNIDDLLKVNVATKSSYGPYKKTISVPHHMSLNDIKNQVENIMIKINSDDNNKLYSTESLTNAHFLLNDKKMPLNKFPLKSNFNYFYTTIPEVNKYSKSNLKIKPNSENLTILNMEQNSEFVEDHSYSKIPTSGFINYEVLATQTPFVTSIPAGNLLPLGRSVIQEEKEKYKPYPDYFSDLLMWNKDLLNSDRVPTPWLDILKNMNHELEYSTPDIGVLQQELIKINDGYNPNINNFKSSLPSTYSHESVTSRNWLQNMILEKPPLEKSILIEQEKKIVKFDPKITDRRLKAADFVNKLNNFAKTLSDDTKYNLNKINNEPEYFVDNKDQSVILVDTTMLAYDDDLNFFSTLTPRELSKNALRVANLGNKVAVSPKSKSNKQPLQYFATPLPMKMTDFEDFLKANRIDVESVTSPIVDLPTINENTLKKYSKENTIKKITFTTTKKKQNIAKAKTTNPKPNELHNTKKIHLSVNVDNENDPNYQFDYLDNLEWDLFKDYYNTEGKERFKRYNDLHYDSYITNLNTEKSNTANEVMQKHVISNEKPYINKESDYKVNAMPEIKEYMTPKDFEITIINFGDINNMTDENTSIKSKTTNNKFNDVTGTTSKDVAKTPMNVDFIEKDSKDSEFLHKLHNNLFYDETYAKNTEMTTREKVKIGEITLPSPPLAFHEAVLKKMPIKTNHEPKRVHISSQSYKYDIIYHHPEKIKIERDTHFKSHLKTTEVATAEELFPSYNSDFASAGGSDVARSDYGKSRIVRKVKTSSGLSTIETHQSSTSNLNRNSKRHLRRNKIKRLFPVIQDKFRMFCKNSSSSHFVPKSSTTILPSSSVNVNGKSTKMAIHHRTDAEIERIEKSVTHLLKNFTSETGKKQMKRVAAMMTDGKLITVTPTISLTTKVGKNGCGDISIHKTEPYVDFYATDRQISEVSKICNATRSIPDKDFINKREIQGLETHTAKDVAALEVIVDMMKNPLKYDECDRHSSSYVVDSTQANDKISANTNSIHVHIAVPYEIDNSKKRSLEPVKVRKVFSAKLSTPVDIEYQVHSFEGPPTTQKLSSDIGGLSPGVYLLVDNTYFPQGVALKPMKVKQIKHTTEKITSTVPTKNLAKVTLSKDFISAINKQLILLYNLTLNKDKRDITNDTNKHRSKRSINWDVVNKFFGHDRVCHCKCKVNTTLCRACAASDAIMSELIFEFENLSKYMSDHCTEIQTYFWMNPSGGKRLKDSVHKIDQSLRDYYKRVKGKCQGRTCKTFSTFIDKREFHKNHKRSKDAGHNFINDLEAITKDIEKATKTVTCLKENLGEEVEKLKYIINNCILVKPHEKRSDFLLAQNKDVQNVYSLEKINVNIICNTESTLPYIESITASHEEKDAWIDNEYKEQRPKGFMGFLSRFRKKKKEKLLAEYLKQPNKSFHKRAVMASQIESPLISDMGGSFWHDYIRRGKESKFEVQTELEDTFVNKKNNAHMEFTKKKVDDSSLSTSPAYTMNNCTENEKLINNISQFLKRFSTVAVQQRTECKQTPPTNNISTTYQNRTKKIKHKKVKSQSHQTIKPKVHKKHNATNVTNKQPPHISTESQYKSNREITDKNMRVTKTLSMFNIKSLFKTTTDTTTETTTVTRRNIFKKFKMVTADFLKKNGNSKITQDTFPIKREHNKSVLKYTADIYPYNTTILKSTISGVHVTSNMTTENNPNIIIIDDTDEPQSEKYKDLLLSIIDYKSNKLNNEWLKFANINLDKVENKQTKQHKSTKQPKTPSKNKDSTISYDILHDLQPFFSAKSNETETTISISALLNKIGSNFKVKIINDEAAAQKKSVSNNKTTTKIMKTHSHTGSVQREADDSILKPRMCNVQATSQHILNIRKEMPINAFEEYAANVSCQDYIPAPKIIFLREKRNEHHRNTRKWNWIRDRRSAFLLKLQPIMNTIGLYPCYNSEFEVFSKGKHGIYKQNRRRKRCAESIDLVNELKALPRLLDSENDIYALAGDTVAISALCDSKQSFNSVCTETCAWKSERDSMLNYTNVVIDGDVINIFNVQPKNDGYYVCKKSGLMDRKIKLAVLKLPMFHLLSTLLYAKDTECTYDDIKRIKLLGAEISNEVFQGQSSVNIDDPVCLEDKVDGEHKVRAVASFSCPRPAVDCSVSCRRDLQAAFASICAENIPALASIQVVLLKDGINSTWRPSKHHRRSIVTRRLRGNNDFTSHGHNLSPVDLVPRGLRLVVSCPAGYRLLSHLKVCTPCPVNTYARKGDNTCSVCPRGSRSTPGADRCRCAVSKLHRYDWWICPPCGYSVVAVVTLCCCGVCVALALLVQATSRSCGATDAENAKDSSELPRKAECRMKPGPTRSSRVILARFFKPSLSSSMATDSQETKFDMWRAMNLPPPLPPIDFDS